MTGAPSARTMIAARKGKARFLATIMPGLAYGCDPGARLPAHAAAVHRANDNDTLRLRAHATLTV